jgi:nucleotide-binding universal stress UspA family protein
LKEAGVPGEPLIEIGDVASGVRHAAEKLHADAVVIGRGHHNGVLGLLRTHSYAIIRESPCPVLAV